MMKYKLSFMLTLFLGILSVQASQTTTQNPLEILFDQAILNIYNAESMSVALNDSLKTYIQEGSLNNALYARMLLGEFYCARCAIGASPFTNSALAQKLPYKFPAQNDNSTSGGVIPGGFTSKVSTFVTDATTYAANLKAARLQFEQGGLYGMPGSEITIAPNPLDSFAGVIIIPTKEFTANLGKINIDNSDNFISQPTFIPYKSTTKDPASANVSVNASFYINEVKTNPVSLIDITLSALPSTAKVNGQPVPFRLQSIKGSISKETINMSIYEGDVLTPQGDALHIQNFIDADPNNPWALVIQLNATKNTPGKLPTYITTSTIPALVRLNPMDYPPNTTIDFKTLVDYPSELYNSIPNTRNTVVNNIPPDATCTGRLLRGIANGYLMSWEYTSLVNPAAVMKPKPFVEPQTSYPTPSQSQFNNNSDPVMLYALSGSRKALKAMYITQAALPQIEQIIANPFTTSVEGYIEQKEIYYQFKPYYPICNQIGNMSLIFNTSPTKLTFLNRTITYLSKPLNKIKNLFSKRITF